MKKNIASMVRGIMVSMPEKDCGMRDLRVMTDTCSVLLKLYLNACTKKVAKQRLKKIYRLACARDAERAGETE